MREISRREFYLLLVAPVVVILGIYYVVFDSRVQKELTQLETGNAAARQSIASMDQSITAAKKAPPYPIASARQELALLNKQMDADRKNAAIRAHPGSVIPIRWTTVTGRVDAVNTIESTLQTNGLLVVSCGADGEAGKVVPKQLADFAEAVKKDGNHPLPEVWRFNVVGTYGDVLASLNALGKSDDFIIPLSADMRALPGDPTRRVWSIWIWV